MNSQIESWRVLAFANNVLQLSQQKGSRLADKCRKEMFKGKAEFFDRLGLATAQLKAGRNSDTPDLDIEHSRRMVTTSMYEWATLVDRKDKLQNIHNPENEYAVSARNALGRSLDDVIIAAGNGSARAGEDGSSSVSLPNAQKVAAVSAGVLDYANVQLLRKAKLIMDAAEVEGKRYLVHGAAFLESLLGRTEITSSDYNTVKALVNGELNTFLGFEFIHSERLPLAATYDANTFKFNTSTGLYDGSGTVLGATDKTALCFSSDALILGMNEGMVGRIDEREDKSYSTQVYASMDFGAVRMEEAKVVQLIVKA